MKLIFFFLLLFCSATQGWSKPSSATHHVLILNSYHQGFKWSDQIVEGIRTALLKENIRISVHIEHMDTKRHPNQDFKDLSAGYTKKYKTLDLDLIISADDNAFNFIKKYRPEISANTPLVFCGVNYLTEGRLEGLSNFTGVNEAADIEGTLDLMLKLHPDTKRIIAITDLTTTGYINKEKINSLRPNYLDKAEIILWDDLSYAELLQNLGRLSRDDIVLFTSFFRDRLGQSFEYAEIAEDITSASPVPVYGNWDYNLGHGIVGGVLASGHAQGAKAGQFGVRIIKGESASTIPIQWQSPNLAMFDEVLLDRFDMKKTDVPSGAVIINHTPTDYEEHKTVILASLAAIMGLLGVIAFLLANTKKRIRAEKDLRLSEIRYHDLIELLPQTVFEMDDKGQITYVNQFGLTWSGYADDDLLSGFFVQKLFHPDDQVRLRDNISSIHQGAPLRGNEYRVVKKDGTVVPVLSYSRPFQKEDNSIGLRGVLTDISAIHRAEQEAMLVRLYLKNVVDLMPMILIGADRDGIISLWNENATIIAGTTPEEAQGKPLVDVLPALASEQANIKKAICENRTISELRVQRNLSGDERYWDILIYPLSLQELESAIIIINDVTDQIQMEKVMVQTEKMMSVGGLAAGMAHEINNPLAAILQSTQVMSRRLSPDLPKNIQTAQQCGVSFEKISQYLECRKIPAMIETILESGSRVSDIIQDMLSFSRSEDSKEIVKSKVDIHELITQALNFAKKDHINYDFNYINVREEYGDIPTVFCSKGQIQQVLLNIIKNGAEAMAGWEQMSDPQQFIIRTHQTGDFVRIEIEDNGPGIPKAVQKRIFEPFFTTKALGVGTGLGLSISYFIITQNHDGVLDIVSSPDKGAKFIIDLPATL